MMEQSTDIESVLDRLDEMEALPKTVLAQEARALSAEQLALSEVILEA